MGIFRELKERGLVKQSINEEELEKLLDSESVSFYCGYDPTADSLTVGHFMTIMLCARLQRAGHKPYFMLGGATAMIGDPTGRTDMRKMLTKEQIDHNVECIKKQLGNIVSFEGENGAVVLNNADWLLKLNYIDFIREIGINMSVNHMLSCECFKSRWERGLSFLEFNYMPMQAYDFYYLNKKYNVKLEVGGDDQWSNILAGADLIRRKTDNSAFAFTIPLLTNSDGKKMGKTAAGAVWLDKNKTSPYELYQYFRNIEDEKVYECLCYLTLLPLDEIKKMTAKGADINKAKEILGYEIVKLVHSQKDAESALNQAKAAFGGNSQELPTENLSYDKNIKLLDLLCSLNICSSKSEGRRLIEQNAIKIDDDIVSDVLFSFDEKYKNKEFVLQKGKKIHKKVKLV